MRIVGGLYKGRKIAVSRSFESRPTTDFAREALFNILSNHFDFEQSAALDLFSGTGSISLELASRGCGEIDLVDINGKSVNFINKIATELSIQGIHTIRMDVFKFIQICKKQYDIIFADPPYNLEKLKELPDQVFFHNLLKPGGWFILEHGKSDSFSKNPHFFDERHYGGVNFSFFR